MNTPLGPVLFAPAERECLIDAAHNQANLVAAPAGTRHPLQRSTHLYYGMNTGCLIGKDSLAFAYEKDSLRKPIMRCNPGGMPMLIPMLLDGGRWTGHL